MLSFDFVGTLNNRLLSLPIPQNFSTIVAFVGVHIYCARERGWI